MNLYFAMKFTEELRLVHTNLDFELIDIGYGIFQN